MHGQHARPTSTWYRPAPTAPTRPPGHARTRHTRRGWITGRLRRRILAYRAVEFLTTHIPGTPGPGEECLLLVHARQVVGQVQYRLCADCARGVITGVTLDERFLSTGLGTRALSHLRTRHPGVAWHSTLRRRTTRDLLRRMQILPTSSDAPCPHADRPPPAPPQAAT
ncbi:hypothetical protein [Streptomyces sp. NPDC053755]|uniref:hypothetical protein n=1 Tax=Streptomyces sp. NPDC053755 TaxID=3155815 RepID=UPI00341946C6